MRKEKRKEEKCSGKTCLKAHAPQIPRIELKVRMNQVEHNMHKKDMN